MTDIAGATFSFYIHDDRYSVPTLLFVDASDPGALRRAARKRLAESTHHTAIEVRRDDSLLFTLARGGA